RHRHLRGRHAPGDTPVGSKLIWVGDDARGLDLGRQRILNTVHKTCHRSLSLICLGSGVGTIPAITLRPEDLMIRPCMRLPSVFGQVVRQHRATPSRYPVLRNALAGFAVGTALLTACGPAPSTNPEIKLSMSPV